MRSILRALAVAGILTVGTGLGIGTSSAMAQGFAYGGYPAGGYYGGGHHHGGFYGGGYGVPSYGYYGNGGHDTQPHWHTRQGLFGTRSYYGLGAHDFRPHPHIQTPYGITGYNQGLFGGTQSYSPPAPFVYRPW